MDFIGLFDLFKQPVKFTLRKNWGHRFDNGSIAGFSLTMTLMIISGIYINSQHTQMENFAYDTFKSEKITNSMKEWAEFKMDDYNFMPTLEIIQGGEETGGFKITDILD